MSKCVWFIPDHNTESKFGYQVKIVPVILIAYIVLLKCFSPCCDIRKVFSIVLEIYSLSTVEVGGATFKLARLKNIRSEIAIIKMNAENISFSVLRIKIYCYLWFLAEVQQPLLSLPWWDFSQWHNYLKHMFWNLVYQSYLWKFMYCFLFIEWPYVKKKNKNNKFKKWLLNNTQSVGTAIVAIFPNILFIFATAENTMINRQSEF